MYLRLAIIVAVFLCAGILCAEDAPRFNGRYEFEFNDATIPAEVSDASTEMTEAARQRAAAYASYAAGIHISNHLGEDTGYDAETAMEKFIQAALVVDDPVPVMLRAMALLDENDLRLDDYFERLMAVIDAAEKSPMLEMCAVGLMLRHGDEKAALERVQPLLQADSACRADAFKILGKHYVDNDRLDDIRALVERIEADAVLVAEKELYPLRMNCHTKLQRRDDALKLAEIVVLDKDTYRQADCLKEMAEALEFLDVPALQDAFIERFLKSWAAELSDEDVTQLMTFRVQNAIHEDDPVCFDHVVAMTLALPQLPDELVAHLARIASVNVESDIIDPTSYEIYSRTLERLLPELIRRGSEDEPVLHRILCRIFFICERYDDAADELLKLPMPSLDEKAQMTLVHCLEASGRYDEAQTWLDRLMRLGVAATGKPTLEYYVTSGIMAENAGKTDKALELLEHGVKDYPDAAVLANGLGYTMADHNVDLPRAEELIRLALRKEPDNTAYLDSLAWVLYRKGDIVGALEAMADVVQKLPADASADADNLEIFSHLSQILNALGYSSAGDCWLPVTAVQKAEPAVEAEAENGQ